MLTLFGISDGQSFIRARRVVRFIASRTVASVGAPDGFEATR